MTRLRLFWKTFSRAHELDQWEVWTLLACALAFVLLLLLR